MLTGYFLHGQSIHTPSSPSAPNQMNIGRHLSGILAYDHQHLDVNLQYLSHTPVHLHIQCIMQVVRYTALFSGIVYGFVHNRTLYKEAEAKKANAAIKQRESWIEQAKKEYAQKQQSSTGSTLRQLASSATGGLISGGDNGELQSKPHLSVLCLETATARGKEGFYLSEEAPARTYPSQLKALIDIVSLPLSASSPPVITDPEDPKFDLEKLIQSWEKSS